MDLNDGIGRTKQGARYAYNDTNVIDEHASRIEKLEDGAGAQFRRVCESKGLVAHTANYDDRNTWFSGDGKASSVIDYIAGPALLHIRKAGQLATLGALLQPVDITNFHLLLCLKDQLQTITDDMTEELTQIQQHLTQITKILAGARHSQYEIQPRLNDEIHEAWEKRDMKTAFRLMRQLAGSKVVKKRDWRLIRQALPTRQECENLLREEGCQGGLLAKTTKTTTWDHMREEHNIIASRTPLPPSDITTISRPDKM